MPRGDSRSAISAAVLDGISQAAKIWDSMSGEWLWQAPEYFVTTSIAQKLHARLRSTYVCLEWSTKQTLADSRSQPRRGRPHANLSGSKRFDIVAFYSSGAGRPRAAIEVKHRFIAEEATLDKDFNRLANAISERANGSSLGYGCLAVYLEVGSPKRGNKTSEEKLLERVSKIERWAKLKIAENPRWADSIRVTKNVGKPVVKDDGAYCGLVIELSHPQSRGSR